MKEFSSRLPYSIVIYLLTKHLLQKNASSYRLMRFFLNDHYLTIGSPRPLLLLRVVRSVILFIQSSFFITYSREKICMHVATGGILSLHQWDRLENPLYQISFIPVLSAVHRWSRVLKSNVCARPLQHMKSAMKFIPVLVRNTKMIHLICADRRKFLS